MIMSKRHSGFNCGIFVFYRMALLPLNRGLTSYKTDYHVPAYS